MAARVNYYEIIETLSFDPIEAREKKILDAINMWKLLEEKRSIASDEDYAAQARRKLRMYEDIKACLTDKDRRKNEAEEMKKKQVGKLAITISTIKESFEDKHYRISNLLLMDIAKAHRLDIEKTVRPCFVEAGFEVEEKKTNPAAALFPSGTVSAGIAARINSLKTDKSAQYPWLDQVNNLYDLAAFSQGEGARAINYHLKSAEDLKKIMSAGATATSGKLDEANHDLAYLYNAGVTQIFKDEAARKKYDNELKLTPLNPLFDAIRVLPNNLRRNPYVAESCIEKIRKIYADYDLAVAIYSLKVCPYEPSDDTKRLSFEDEGNIKLLIKNNRIEMVFDPAKGALKDNE